SGIRLTHEWTKGRVVSLISSMIFAAALYNWKSGGFLTDLFYRKNWFPVSLATTYADLIKQPQHLLGTILISASSSSVYYTLAYSALVLIFEIKRMRLRKTPYIAAQTTTLMLLQILPLFLLPEILLPWLGHNNGLNKALADGLFPLCNY